MNKAAVVFVEASPSARKTSCWLNSCGSSDSIPAPTGVALVCAPGRNGDTPVTDWKLCQGGVRA